MFGFHSQDGYREILDGIRIKTVAHGPKSLMSEFRMTRGSVLPSHSHPYEQTGYLVAGRVRMSIGSGTRELKPGDSWNIRENVTHKAEILEDSVAIEVFCPVREDYLKYVNQEDVRDEEGDR